MRKSFVTFLIRLGLVLICLGLAAFVRIHNKDFVLSPRTGHFNFIDTDCYYYARRLVHYIANFPNIMVFDPLLDWPRGAAVDWPEGFLLLLGFPLKMAGVSNFAQLELGISLMMIGLGLLCCLIIFNSASTIIKDINLRILLLAFAACNFLLVRFSCLGQVDHHIVEAIFPPLIFWLSLRAFENRSIASSIFLGLLLTYSLTISSSSLFVITAFFGAYGFILGSSSNRKHFILFFLALIASLSAYAYWSVSRRGSWLADNYPSYFHVVFVSCLAALSIAVATWRRKALWLIGGAAIMGCLFHLLNWPLVLVYPLRTACDYVFGKSGVLQNVSEAFPIYASFDGVALGFMHINFGLLIYLLPFVWILNFFPKKYSTEERTLFFLLSVVSIPAIAQKRFSHLMIGLYLIYLIWLLSQLVERMRQPDFLKSRMPIKCSPLLNQPWFPSAAVTTLICVWTLFTILIPMTLGGLAPYGSPRDAVDLGTSQVFLDKLKMDPQLAWDRLAGKVSVTEGIWANPNMGHMLLYYTGLGTVNNSFYHPQSFNLDFELRNIESTEELKKKLIENKIRYFILADDFQFFELQFQLVGKKSVRFKERRNVNGQMVTGWLMDELTKLAWVRLLTADQEVENIKRIFSVRFDERHYYTFLRGFELTK
jgi:hypothetical protein